MLVLNLPRKLLPLIMLISLLLAARSRLDVSSLRAQTRPFHLEANGQLGASDFPDQDEGRIPDSCGLTELLLAKS